MKREAAESMQLAFEFKASGDIDGAKVLFSRAISKMPKSSADHTICLSELADIEERREDWLQAIRLNLNVLIDLEHRLGERDEVTIAVMDKTAGLFAKIGRNDESSALFERARNLSQRSLWADQAQDQGSDVPVVSRVPEPLNLGVTAESARKDLQLNKAPSMVMLEAFENAYKPYLSNELVPHNDDDLEKLADRFNKKDSLAKLRRVKEDSDEEETGIKKFWSQLKARLIRILEPIMRNFGDYLADRQAMLLVLLVAGPVFVLAGLFVMARMQSSASTTYFLGHASHGYASADMQKRFEIMDKDDSIIGFRSDKEKVNWRLFSGNWTDLVTLVGSQILEKQLWISHLPYGCVDQTGGALFTDDGPERRTLNSAEVLNLGATYFFAANKNYPTTIEQLNDKLKEHEQSELNCRNEFTGTAYVPKLIVSDFTPKSDQEGNIYRADILNHFRQGTLLEKENAFAAGEIRAYSLSIKLSRGTISEFFVRAAGRDGAPLIGNQAGNYYFIGQEDGTEMKTEKPKGFFSGDFSLRKKIIWLFEGGISSYAEWLLRNLGWILSLIAGVGMLVTYFCLYKKTFLKSCTLISSIALFSMALLYYLSPILP